MINGIGMKSAFVQSSKSVSIPLIRTWQSINLFLSSSWLSNSGKEFLSKASLCSESENIVNKGLRMAFLSHALATLEYMLKNFS